MFHWLMRCSCGFFNPNHAAAMICALLPLCWGWRRHAWFGWAMFAALCVLLALTQSRTGLVLMAIEAIAFSKWKVESVKCKMAGWLALFIAIAVAALWMWPRLAIDDSILNRPRIWIAGLQLFAANPSGVELGNSGAVASAFLLPDIPEIRTMISAHITLLAEFGWRVGLVWLSFILLALPGLRRSPRVGIALAGLVVSGCSSTIFDWPVLFDASDFGGLGVTNWILSWAMLLMFVVMGCLLIAKSVVPWRRKLLQSVLFATAFAGSLLSVALMVPKGGAPMVRNGYAFCGESPRTLALYDGGWRLRTVLPRVGGAAVLPIHAVSRFPHDIDLSGVDKVLLFGNCREWSHLVKGVPVLCSED